MHNSLSFAIALSSATLFFAGTAEALVIVSGDSNILEPVIGQGQTLDGGVSNRNFFTNILNGGTNVLVKQSDSLGTITTPGDGQALSNFYNNMSGINSSFTQTSLGSNALDNIDLFISILPINATNGAYTASELNQIDALVDRGGTVFFLGENSDGSQFSGGNIANNNINTALSFIGSSMQIINAQLDPASPNWSQATGSEINTSNALTNGVTSFDYAFTSSVFEGVSGGEALFFTSDGTTPFVAVEDLFVPPPAPVPEPLTILGSFVALGFGAAMRKKKQND